MMGIKSGAVLLLRKFITSKSPHLRMRALHLCTILNNNPAERVVGVKKTAEKQSKDIQEIQEYFARSNSDDELDKLPPRIVKQRKSKPDHLYLLSHETADHIIDLIKDDLVENPHNIIEVNPGTGVLTERLLATGIPSVTILEASIQLIRVLAALQMIYIDRITIREADLLNIWKIAYQDKQDDAGRVAALLSNFPHAKWGEDAGLKIIAAVANGNFIRHIILDVVRQCGLVSYGRPCFYLFITPVLWTRFTCSKHGSLNDYRGSSVLFQLLFDYEMLGQVPRKAFLPWTPSYGGKNAVQSTAKSQMHSEHMYVVKVEGKKNLLTEIIDEERIRPLWYFINHHMVARTGRIIPQLEVWEPGCGPKLIMQGFNIFTQFGDLSPFELLKLFKEFSTWDGYHNSFLPAMENASHKMEQLLF